MGNNVATRVLLLLVAVLAASLVGLTAGWVTWAVEPNLRATMFTTAGAFAVSLGLLLTVFNFVMRHDEA
ncbi:hypothetical protein [Micromonospora avicenniae]|uniref:hypothetical protein n=1 Tax=Micromonospora avicenniae TaxID=1198245 RepID=UPI00331BD96C